MDLYWIATLIVCVPLLLAVLVGDISDRLTLGSLIVFVLLVPVYIIVMALHALGVL